MAQSTCEHGKTSSHIINVPERGGRAGFCPGPSK